jgi:hypothetical protein
MSTCRDCAHATKKPGHEKMYRLGYRNCVHKPEHIFVPGHQACMLKPQRWKAAKTN